MGITITKNVASNCSQFHKTLEQMKNYWTSLSMSKFIYFPNGVAHFEKYSKWKHLKTHCYAIWRNIINHRSIWILELYYNYSWDLVPMQLIQSNEFTEGSMKSSVQKSNAVRTIYDEGRGWLNEEPSRRIRGKDWKMENVTLYASCVKAETSGSINIWTPMLSRPATHWNDHTNYVLGGRFNWIAKNEWLLLDSYKMSTSYL